MALHLRAVTASLLAAGLAFAPMAQARDWHHGDWHDHGYPHRNNNAAGAAIVGGLIGLGVGAAIANSNRPYYYGPPAYYAPPPAVYYGY